MNIKYLNRWQRDGASHVGGTGSAGTLPMGDKEKKAAAERENGRAPIGFAPPHA